MGCALLRRLLAGAAVAALPLLAAAGPAASSYDDAVEQTDAEDPAVAGVPAPRRVPRWIDPGDGTRLIAESTYSNELGHVAVKLARGELPSIDGHPFFEALGTNGRACVTCHQPQDAMSLSVDTVRWMWRATRGSDPMFAAVDGRDCPNLPEGVPAAHSMMLGRALTRVALPWPPRDADGRTLHAEFTLEVARDPTGCNLHPEHGLHSPHPTISVYRRPRPAANLPFALTARLMADGRAPTLAAQAADAAAGHLEARQPLTPAQLQAVVDFESQVFTAQDFDRRAGALAGAVPLAEGTAQSLTRGAAGLFAATEADEAPRRKAARDAITRGAELFATRRFDVDDAMPPRPGLRGGHGATCATCHGNSAAGLDVPGAFIDTGVTSFADAAAASPDLPLFEITCSPRARPHPVLGRHFFTQDPGRALVTGRCRDVGAVATQQLRGLAARPPYFTSGAARDLRAVVDHYDTRYRMGLTEEEKGDLVAFLGAL